MANTFLWPFVVLANGRLTFAYQLAQLASYQSVIDNAEIEQQNMPPFLLPPHHTTHPHSFGDFLYHLI